MNLIGVPYQIIIRKKSENDLVEFRKVGENSQIIKLSEIINIIKKQKEKN